MMRTNRNISLASVVLGREFLLHPTIKILMKPNASLLVTASFMTLILVLVGLLRSTSQQAIDAEPTPDALSLVTPLLPSAPSLSQPSVNAMPSDAVDALLDRPIHTATGKRETLKRRFSIDQSLDRVQQIDRVLASARTPTAKKRPEPGNQPTVSGDSATSIAQTSASNWANAVTGTLKKQDYDIKKLELALAQKQFKDGEIPQTALAQKQASYQTAAREFKTFLNTVRTADSK